MENTTQLTEKEILLLQNIQLKRENIQLRQRETQMESFAVIAPVAERLGVDPGRVQVDLGKQTAWALEEIKKTGSDDV